MKAAWDAFESWKNVTVSERAAILNRIADIIDENTEFLAMVESLDNGKPIRETMAVDIPLSAQHFRYFAGCILAEEGSAAMLGNDTLSLILREPIGVVGQIVPWNFPFLMAAWKLAPVLASGCCTVFKTSSSTPLSVLELGGKSANIFFSDCDWEMAMDGLQMGILFNQGQVCCAGSRVFVQEDIYDRFVEDAVKRFDQVKVGLPWESDTQMGSQINRGQMNKILKYIEIGKEEGAAVLCGGYQITDGELGKGSFIRPTLLGNVTNDMRVARGIETGRMWVNTYNSIPEGAPFGGYKTSGIGRETHKVILEHYTQMKDIMINLSESPTGFYPVK